MKLNKEELLGSYRRSAELYAMITLDWGEEEYYAFVFEQGIKYLEHTIPDAMQMAEVAAHSGFWQWWRRHWYSRDAAWLHQYNKGFMGEMTMTGMRHAYRRLHDAETLAAAEMGFGKVLEESYASDLVPELK